MPMKLDKIEEHPVSPAASSLLADSLVWDNHMCMPLRADDESFLPQLERCKRAGYNVVTLNIGFDGVPWEEAIRVVATMRRWLQERREHYLLCESVSDVLQARDENKLAVAFDLEGGVALNDHLPMVGLYYDLGVRWILFAYNRNNSLGGGCNDKPTGLTHFGRQVLAEAERVGMVVCCSHTGEQTATEIMELAKNPVIFSHSNPASLKSHYRNISDDLIRRCAAIGGVIGINGIGDFLGDNDSRTETYVRHIDYVAGLVGAEHVGLGTDYVFDSSELEEYVSQNPELYDANMRRDGFQMVSPEQIPEVAEQLLRMNHSESDVRKVLGENFLRVANSVWR